MRRAQQRRNDSETAAYYGAISLVVFPASFYFIFVGSELVFSTAGLRWLANLSIAALTASTLGNLVACHVTDPGVIPPQPKPPNFDETDGAGVVIFRDIPVLDSIVRTTYCS